MPWSGMRIVLLNFYTIAADRSLEEASAPGQDCTALIERGRLIGNARRKMYGVAVITDDRVSIEFLSGSRVYLV